MSVRVVKNSEKLPITTVMPKPRVRVRKGRVTTSNDKPKGKVHDSDEPNNGGGEDPIIKDLKDEIAELKKKLGEPDDPDDDSDDPEKLEKRLRELQDKERKKKEEGEKQAEEQSAVVLPDGSIFLAKKRKWKAYDAYYYVVYDWWTYFNIKVLMNWWTQVDVWEITHITYEYISGPTHEIPDYEYRIHNETYKLDYNSCDLSEAKVAWHEGVNRVGENPIWVEHIQPVNTFDEFQAEFEQFVKQVEQEASKSGIKVSSTEVEGGEAVNVQPEGISESMNLPPEFFLVEHTLKELLELHLISGEFTEGLYDKLDSDAIKFYIECFPYIQEKTND